MCICNGRVQIRSPPAGRRDACVRLNIKEVLAATQRHKLTRLHIRIWGLPKGCSVLLKGQVGMGSLLGLCRLLILTQTAASQRLLES